MKIPGGLEWSPWQKPFTGFNAVTPEWASSSKLVIKPERGCGKDVADKGRTVIGTNCSVGMSKEVPSLPPGRTAVGAQCHLEFTQAPVEVGVFLPFFRLLGVDWRFYLEEGLLE